jgi:hypothetical protein
MTAAPPAREAAEEETYEDALKRDLEDARKRASSFDNSIGVIMSNALDAAQNMHIAYCRAGNGVARNYLTKALHSALIIAEQCRQEMERTAP